MGMGGGRGGCGCSSIIMIIVVMVVLMAVISWLNNWGPMGNEPPPQALGVATSSRIRERLPEGAANELIPVYMYTDNIGLIQNPDQLEAGLQIFFNRTGVRPHVYITDNLNGNTNPDDHDMQAYASSMYNQLFGNFEGHLLLLFFESGTWPHNTHTRIWMTPGIRAALVMDVEAREILADFIEYYDAVFYSPIARMNAELMFSNAFERTAEVIMHRPPDNRIIWITLIVAASVVLVVTILYNFWKKKQIQKNLEAEQTERILSQDLSTFSEDEATRLARQYEDE